MTNTPAEPHPLDAPLTDEEREILDKTLNKMKPADEALIEAATQMDASISDVEALRDRLAEKDQELAEAKADAVFQLNRANEHLAALQALRERAEAAEKALAERDKRIADLEMAIKVAKMNLDASMLATAAECLDVVFEAENNCKKPVKEVQRHG